MTGYDGRGGRYDITVPQSTDVTIVITAPVDLSSATCTATVYDSLNVELESFTPAISGSGSNIATFTVTDTQLDALVGPASWAFKVRRGGDDKVWIAGDFVVVAPDQPRRGTSDHEVTVTTADAVTITVDVAAIGGAGVTSLDELTDVTITTPVSGNALTYNGTAWVNSTPAAGLDDAGVAALVDDPGSDTTTALTAQYVSIASAATADFEDIDATINTADKYTGKMAWDTTTGAPVWATGPLAADTWVDATGTLVYTPTAGGTPSYFTGGTVTVDGLYRYHTFNTSGTLTFVDVDGALDVDYLVVAGGGGGGTATATGRVAGGGGAGGLLTTTSYSLGSSTAITVGAGGAVATSGSASSLGAIASTVGGGAGGADTSNGAIIAAMNGGSGGGLGKFTNTAYPDPGGAGTAGQGFAGGGTNSTSGAGKYAGSGGGASAAAVLGAGGAGVDQWGGRYADGGGGAAYDTGLTTPGGSSGGSGGVELTAVAATSGDPNTGGGGGGGGAQASAAGGSGVVIVRYPDDASYPGPGTYFDGTNYAITPTDAALDVSGDLSLMFHGAANDWTAASLQVLVSRSYFNYEMRLDITTGYVNVVFNNSFNVNSGAAPVVADGDDIWIGFTCDMNDGGGSYQAKFWTSADGVSWTQLGTTKTGTAFTINNSARDMAVGSRSVTPGQLPFTGTIYYAAVHDGIGDGSKPGLGTLVAETDLSNPWPGDAYTDGAGNDWTFV